MADELHRALQAAPNLHPPYVLVGHSFGGLVARLYCALHRDHVAGLVLVDSSHEDQMARLTQAFPGAHTLGWVRRAAQRRALPLGFLRLLEDLGLADSRWQEAIRTCPADLARAHLALGRTRHARQAQVQEALAFAVGDHNELRRQAVDLGDLPLTVLTGGDRGRKEWHRDWLALQRDLAGMSTRSSHVYASHTGHHVHQDDPGLVVETIREFVEQAIGHPLPGPSGIKATVS